MYMSERNSFVRLAKLLIPDPDVGFSYSVYNISCHPIYILKQIHQCDHCAVKVRFDGWTLCLV